MLTKDAKQRADWAEIFTYEFTKPGGNDLKESLATTATINLNHKMRSPGKVTVKEP